MTTTRSPSIAGLSEEAAMERLLDFYSPPEIAEPVDRAWAYCDALRGSDDGFFRCIHTLVAGNVALDEGLRAQYVKARVAYLVLTGRFPPPRDW